MQKHTGSSTARFGQKTFYSIQWLLIENTIEMTSTSGAQFHFTENRLTLTMDHSIFFDVAYKIFVHM